MTTFGNLLAFSPELWLLAGALCVFLLARFASGTTNTVALVAVVGAFLALATQFKQMITIDDYFSFSSMIVLASGAVFETPILIFFLARFGIVTPAFLLQKFKYAVVLSFILAAIVTPTPDMVTQTALAVPMIALYLLGIAVAFLFGKKHEA